MKRMLQKGFTLIELVVVIVILGILAAVAIPQFTDLTASAKTAVGQAACGALQSTAVLLFASNRTSSNIGTIQGATTIAPATWSGSCGTPIYTNADTTTTTNCATIPVALCL
jgi:prepilin-type N-terminal cleavage/methylation domain-containing protein